MNQLLRTDQSNTFNQVVALIEQTIAPTSWRIYADTYRQWIVWCAESNTDIFEITPLTLREFLIERGNTQATRQRMLSSMRRVANYLAAAAPQDARRQLMVQALRDMRAPIEDVAESGRDLRALTHDQVTVLLKIWGHDDPTSSRNSAILALLFSTWLRRSEAAVVQWKHFNTDNGTLEVPHGKGDKARTVAIIGDYAFDHFNAWWDWQAWCATGNMKNNPRAYMFCGIRGEKLLNDKPIDDDTIYRIVVETSERSGIVFSPHDARRTGITEAIEIGGDSVIPDAQANAGHAKSSTTLGYAKQPDAAKRRKRLLSRFG